MSNLQLIDSLCNLLKQTAFIIAEQRKALMQFDAIVAEEEIAEAKATYIKIIGDGEWPDDLPDPEEGGQQDGQ